ncbi:MAG: hypothetical protein ACI4ER_09525 [Suilimivivens sp.]
MLTKEDLNAIENIVGRRFDQVDTRLDRMDERFERIDERLEQMDGRLDQMDKRFDSVEQKVESLDRKIDREIRESEQRMSEVIDRRVERLERDLHFIRVDLLENNVIPRLNTIENCYLSTYERYVANADKMETMSDDISVLKAVVSNHSAQLKRLPCNAQISL